MSHNYEGIMEMKCEIYVISKNILPSISAIEAIII
jgi:hypothetical protein